MSVATQQMKNWFVQIQGKQHGPFSELEIRHGIRDGKIKEFMQIKQGESQWFAMAKVKRRFDKLEQQGYFIQQEGASFGPVTLEKITAMIADGLVTESQFVRKGTVGMWQPAKRYAELAKLFPSAPSISPPPVPSTDQSTELRLEPVQERWPAQPQEVDVPPPKPKRLAVLRADTEYNVGTLRTMVNMSGKYLEDAQKGAYRICVWIFALVSLLTLVGVTLSNSKIASLVGSLIMLAILASSLCIIYRQYLIYLGFRSAAILNEYNTRRMLERLDNQLAD